MTHEELLAKIDLCFEDIPADYGQMEAHNALRAVVELHKPEKFGQAFLCEACSRTYISYSQLYPCPTIQAIEKELK